MTLLIANRIHETPEENKKNTTKNILNEPESGGNVEKNREFYCNLLPCERGKAPN